MHLNKVIKFYKRSTSHQQLSSSVIEFRDKNFQDFVIVPISMLHLDNQDLIVELKNLRNHFIEIFIKLFSLLLNQQSIFKNKILQYKT